MCKKSNNTVNTMNKMATVSAFLSVIILNINGLNSIRRWSGWKDFKKIQWQPKETHFRYKDTHKEQGREKIFHTKGKQNKAGVATFIRQNRLKVKKCQKWQRKTVCNDKKVNSPGSYDNYKYICPKHQSIKIYEKNTDRTKERNESKTIIDFKTLLLIKERISRHKINKETGFEQCCMYQMNITDIYIYRTFYPIAAELTFFLSA